MTHREASKTGSWVGRDKEATWHPGRGKQEKPVVSRRWLGSWAAAWERERGGIDTDRRHKFTAQLLHGLSGAQPSSNTQRGWKGQASPGCQLCIQGN